MNKEPNWKKMYLTLVDRVVDIIDGIGSDTLGLHVGVALQEALQEVEDIYIDTTAPEGE